MDIIAKWQRSNNVFNKMFFVFPRHAKNIEYKYCKQSFGYGCYLTWEDTSGERFWKISSKKYPLNHKMEIIRTDLTIAEKNFMRTLSLSNKLVSNEDGYQILSYGEYMEVEKPVIESLIEKGILNPNEIRELTEEVIL